MLIDGVAQLNAYGECLQYQRWCKKEFPLAGKIREKLTEILPEEVIRNFEERAEGWPLNFDEERCGLIAAKKK